MGASHSQRLSAWWRNRNLIIGVCYLQPSMTSTTVCNCNTTSIYKWSFFLLLGPLAGPWCYKPLVTNCMEWVNCRWRIYIIQSYSTCNSLINGDSPQISWGTTKNHSEHRNPISFLARHEECGVVSGEPFLELLEKYFEVELGWSNWWSNWRCLELFGWISP